MSSHDDLIGQEWTGESWAEKAMSAVFAALTGEDNGFLFILLGYLSSAAPDEFHEGLMATEHSLGRHADGRCPERCPRF